MTVEKRPRKKWLGKKAEGKNGRWKKRPKENMVHGKKADGENEKIIIWRVIFRRLGFLWEIFFTRIGCNLWTNFIGIIWLDKLLRLFWASSVYHSTPPPLKTPTGGGGAPLLGTPLIPEHVQNRYLTQTKTVRGKGKGPFYSSTIFSIGHFFLNLFFPRPFLYVSNQKLESIRITVYGDAKNICKKPTKNFKTIYFA